MRYAAAAAAFALLAACGGDPDPRPTPAPPTATTPSTAPTPSPEALAMRAVVARTQAACPCEVELVVIGGPLNKVELRGVYDPRTGASELRQYRYDAPRAARLRVVEGRTFLDRGDGQWAELDLSGLPKAPVPPLGPLALADPRLAFAAGANVILAFQKRVDSGGATSDVEYDLAAATATMGPRAEVLGRLMREARVYDLVTTLNGLVRTMHVAATGDAGADDGMALTFTVVRTGVAAPAVTVPQGTGTVDVTSAQGLTP